MQFRVLGPLEVVGDDGPIAISAPKQRALLALLIIHVGQVVSVDRIVDALWGATPPRTVEDSLFNTVGRLRARIGAETIVQRPPGYMLAAPPESVDAVRFKRMLARARSLTPAEQRPLLSEALELWRGPAFADLVSESFAWDEALPLDELHVEALELRIGADLALGHGADLVAELEMLVREHPTREGLLRSLMLALYRAGRQADALQVFHDARTVLNERLGIEPGPGLSEAYRSILRQQPELAAGAAGERPDADHTAAVAQALLAGRLVVVLGPSVTADPSDDPEAATTLAAALAERFACPQEVAGDLSRVSQHVAVTHGIGPLYDELHRVHDRDAASPCEQTVAAIAGEVASSSAVAPLLVTAAFGDGLEQELAARGADCDVVSYVALGPQRGRFIHRPAGGAPQVIDLPNAYRGITGERVIVLKVHGGVDRLTGREWESYVVSEDDHIDYLAQTQVAAVLPAAIAARLRRSHFLFLGYPLRPWGLRVFLHRVFARDRLAYRSWAVTPEPHELDDELWAARGVQVITMPPEEFAADLAARIESQGA
jgi:DNA-binding SARP family transcriptional activator